MRITRDGGVGGSDTLVHAGDTVLDHWQQPYHKESKRAPPPASDWERNRRYGIVIDAGSSGSRLQVYSWLDHVAAKEQRQAAGNSIAVLPRIEKGVQQGDGWTLKVEPGLSSLADHPESVDDYLRPLFDHARSIIPPSQLASTPVYILATAGLRLLTDNQSSAILSKACAFIQDSTPFSITDCDEQVRIISGEEEGVYGWVAINYLLDGFDAHGLADKGQDRHSSTYGFLDMGGASTQIAFEPSSDARKEHSDNLLSVNLRLLDGMDVHHPVFVTTWLGYGTNQARERYVDANIKQYIQQHGPSMPTNAKADEHPLVVVEDPCLPKDLLLSESRHKGYASKGTGDFTACMKRSAPLLNTDQDCKDFPCLMGVHVPPIDFKVNHFIGISEYWYSTQDIWKLGGVYDFPTFERSALEYCSQGWENIIQDHSDGGSRWTPGQKPPDVHRLEMQCFKAAWIVNVLHEGIGIPRLTIDQGGEGGRSNGTKEAIKAAEQKGFISPPSFQSVNEINDVAVSWTLGRMVLEVTDSIPKSRKSASHTADEDAGTPVFEWKTGHHGPSWRNKLGSYYRSAASHQQPLAILGLCFVLFAILFFMCSGKRRLRWLRYFKNPRRDDYGLLSMEEGGENDTTDLSSPRKTTNPIARTLLPIRIFASRFVPSVQTSTTSRISMPTRRSSNSIIPLKSTPADHIRQSNKLRHSASSPNLSKKSFDQGKVSASAVYPLSTTSSPGSTMHIDLPTEDSGHPPPLTPPARTNSPGWALRMTPASTPNHVARSQSARAVHRSNTSTSDSEGYLNIPTGVSSTAPNVGATAWEAPPGNGTDSGTVTPEEARPALRSRQSSYTNLSGLARNRGGHSRQISTDVH